MKQRGKRKYYIQFADDLDISRIPVKKMSEIGVWARRSSRIYQGTSSLDGAQIRSWLENESGLEPGTYTLYDEENALILER